MARRLVGVFEQEQQAVDAIEDLKRHGYSPSDISIVTRDRDRLSAMSEETGSMAPEGMAAGVTTGGIAGGALGLLAGLGALAIPGIGPILAAGPIAAALSGAVAGAGALGLVGGLVGLGIPQQEAEEYEGHIKNDRILVMVQADESEAAAVSGILRRHESLNRDRYLEYDAYEDNKLV
ncbi:general stress protein [Paenibacillus beijingensis]|uniref:Low temperature-induced protein n=1 Tax=Paenibacillus beijingensis TaxID=1126833 RepID=A0A0D5NGX1_9BACL|nr:general stress protein [Paenibacillus beijingensis]AJY74619.1 low temperature-induced protein [Paenibacillus beijingensis]